MKTPKDVVYFITIAVLLLTAMVVDAQVSDIEIKDPTDQLRVQAQLILQENAELKKQLAAAQRDLAQVRMELAELQRRNVEVGGRDLLQHLAEKNGVKLESYDFQIGQDGTMKFTPKVETTKETK